MEMRSIIAAVALALIALLLLLDTSRVSPGSIAFVHGAEPELQGEDSCSACHGGFLQSMTDACFQCHDSMEMQIDETTGFHGQLDTDLATQCAACHSEHHGTGFTLVSDRSFVQAGYASRNEYDHAGLDYDLVGAHLGLSCSACHEHADAPVVPIGSQRFLGLDQQCMTCHEDEHEGEYGTSCADCHGQSQPFAEVGGEAHDTFAPMFGHHLEVACEDCHAPETRNSVDALAIRHVAGDISMPSRTCDVCHDTQHDPDFLDGVGNLVGTFPDQRVCQHCHNPDQASFLGTDPQMEDSLHAASGFPLELPHDEVDCQGCHADFGERIELEDPAARSRAFAEAFPGRDADTCSSCHMDAHDGQFTDSPFAADDCLGCHDRTAFAPTAFGVEHHARTDFPLTGSHEAADCLTCHAPPEGSPRITEDGIVTSQFADTPHECSQCHEAPHSEMFLANLSDLMFLIDEESCDTCHDAAHETFLGDNASMETDPELKKLHDASGFTLDAPHGEAACIDCHEGFGERPEDSTDDPFDDPSGDPDEGELFAVFHAAFPGRDDETCQQCHTDPHAEQFVEGAFASQECLACHDRLAFRPSMFGFDHHAQTDFPLTGSHEAVGCNECHSIPDGEPELTEGGLLTRVFEGTSTECSSCHENVHGEAFDRPGLPKRYYGKEGCARCHETETFDMRRSDVFDHALWGGLEHEGAHRIAACNGCHISDRTAEPLVLDYTQVRGEDCSDCHVDQHVGQFDVEGATECTRCHETAETFADLVFDHQVDSRFALDQQHAALECSACHIPMPLTDGTEAIRYKPLGVECSDCHDPEGLQTLERDNR